MSTYEIIRDADGQPLASVCLREPITEDERAVLVEYFTWMRDRGVTQRHSLGEALSAAGRAREFTVEFEDDPAAAEEPDRG